MFINAIKLGYHKGLKVEVHEHWDCAVLRSRMRPHYWIHFWERFCLVAVSSVGKDLPSLRTLTKCKWKENTCMSCLKLWFVSFNFCVGVHFFRGSYDWSCTGYVCCKVIRLWHNLFYFCFFIFIVVKVIKLVQFCDREGEGLCLCRIIVTESLKAWSR